MCSVHSKIIMVAITYGGTTRLHDFRRKTVAPQMYTNDQQTDLYYIIGTGRSKVGTADAPQRIDLRRAPSLVYLPIIHNTNLCCTPNRFYECSAAAVESNKFPFHYMSVGGIYGERIMLFS